MAAISASSVGLGSAWRAIDLAVRRPGGVRYRCRVVHDAPPSLLASPRPSSAADSACHGSVAHFTRDGYSCTPASGASRSSAGCNVGRAIRAGAGARHFAERGEQRARVGLAAPGDRLGHQVGRGDADRAAARIEAGLGDAAVGGVLHPDLDAVAAHRVVALGGGVERGQAAGVARPAAVIQDHFLVEIAQIVERRVGHHVKNSRTRASASARKSISSCVV